MHISIDSKLKAQTKLMSVWFPFVGYTVRAPFFSADARTKSIKQLTVVQHAGIYLYLMAERLFVRVRDKSKNYYFNWTLILCLGFFLFFSLIHWEWLPASMDACDTERKWNGICRTKKSHFRRDTTPLRNLRKQASSGESGQAGAKVEMERRTEKKGSTHRAKH